MSASVGSSTEVDPANGGPAIDTVPSTQFLTGDLPGRDQFDAWREVISVVFNVEPLDDAAGQRFAARANAFHLGELVLVNTQFDGQRFVRTPRQVRTDWLDHFLVQFYRHGGYVGEAGGDGIDIRPDSVSVLDLAQPVETCATAAECVSLVVPRDVMDRLVPNAHELHGRVLEGAASALLGDHFSSLEQRLPGLDARHAPDVMRATCHLVAACLRPTAAHVEQSRVELDGLLLGRARRYIDARMEAPGGVEVGPLDICRAVGVSRSRLYALFQPQGGVRRYVQARRLAHVHAALADPVERRSIMQLAERFGFGSHAQLSREFRHRYGYRPSDVRAQPAAVLQARAARGAGAGTRDVPGFDDWIRALRG